MKSLSAAADGNRNITCIQKHAAHGCLHAITLNVRTCTSTPNVNYVFYRPEGSYVFTFRELSSMKYQNLNVLAIFS
jgi:hypothetical protein